MKDNMVQYEDSIHMLTEGFSKCQAHLFLRENMLHNALNYTNDLIVPLHHFFNYH